MPGYDEMYSSWAKTFTSIHDRLVLEMHRHLQGAHVPECMTKGKIPLIQKDSSKGTVRDNYRPITGLPMTWKILIAQIREEIYSLLTSHEMVPEEQKECHKESRGTAELFNIDQHILNENKSRQKKKLATRCIR